MAPDEGVDIFEVAGDVLRVPGFGRLGGELLYAAATGGVQDSGVVAYLDSILEFAAGDDRRLAGLRRLRRTASGYPTTEAVIPRDRALDNGSLWEEEGLRIVRRACDELEAQLSRLPGPRGREGEPADVS